jgi:hypothetical protein
MKKKSIDIKGIIIKAVVFISLLFVFFNWDAFEKILLTIFK